MKHLSFREPRNHIYQLLNNWSSQSQISGSFTVSLWLHCLTLNTFISCMGKSEIRAFRCPWKRAPFHTKVEGNISIDFNERWLRFPMNWKNKCLNSRSNLFGLFLYVHFEGYGWLRSPLLAKRTQINGAQGIFCLEVIALSRTKC